MRMRPLVATLVMAALLPVPASGFAATSPAAPAIQVILDGKTVPMSPAPVITGGRTLVPVRAVVEAMGATVTWDTTTRTVGVTKGDRFIRLKIDRRLACLSPDCLTAATLDTPAQIFGDRTFVPVRFVSQALGARVTWDGTRNAVIIETDKAPDYAISTVTIPSLQPGQVITGPVALQAAGATGTAVQFLLVDPATGVATIVAAGTDPAATYTFTPDPTVTGNRLVVAVVRDGTAVRYSDPVAVKLALQPNVQLTGMPATGVVDGPITIGADLNFVATQVSYKLIHTDGTSEDLGTVGPGYQVTWYPQISHNGDQFFQAIAMDRAGKTYMSAFIPVKVQSGYRNSLSGLADGDTITRTSLSLRASGNYPIESVLWYLDDQFRGWGFSKSFDFGLENNGAHTLKVDVVDKTGTTRTMGPFNFTVKITPTAWLTGVAPNQVVTGPITLKAGGNVPLSFKAYYLTDELGRTQPLGTGDAVTWTPTTAGKYTVYAVTRDQAGNTLNTDKVSFRVYLGKVYAPQPIVPKDQFMQLSVSLAVPIYKEVGMAASLQVAQSLLETGWGQSAPVDKYTGQISYNLFGIKGTGPAGSIISNTWEEYNGVAYRVDDYFRAYHNVQESFRDHADFLLVRPWYAPFRAVMADPVQGAWALRKSGYATDSQYPVKLISIMKQYDLFKLDQFDF